MNEYEIIEDAATIEKTNITVGMLVKIVIAIVFIVGYSIAVYAWVDSIDNKVNLFIQEQSLLHKQDDAKIQAVLETLSEFKKDQCEIRKVQAELTRAIDRTSVILEEINKKIAVDKSK